MFESMISPSNNVELTHEGIIQKIKNFEETLDKDHEVGMYLTSFNKEILLAVNKISWELPDLLCFTGTVNGSPAQLVQHVTQLNFLLTSCQKPDLKKPARRIGFDRD